MAATTWGDWTFDRRADEIADLAWRGVVVLRSIRAVVRDADWATATPVISHVDHGPESLALHLTWTDLGADIAGVVTVRADDGALTVSFDAESHAAFRTNRAGLVVLHPHRLAGTPLQVAHASGGHEATAFPRAVSAHQPVFDIAGLAWAVDGVEVDLVFRGDVFEMEDQRNWTDASYKTYSRPLDLPFPYDLAAGERVAQSVTVRAGGTPTADGSRGADRIELHAGGAFPEIVVGAASAPEPAPSAADAGALLLELDLSAPNRRAALARAAGTAAALDVRLIAPPAADAPWGTKIPGAVSGTELAAALGSAVRELAGLPVRRVGVFDPVSHISEPALVAALRVAFADAGLSPVLVGGTRSHFTELNREQDRVPADVDAVAFGLTPLFHTLGDEQLFESVAVQRVLAAQAVEIAGDRPVHVGPVTLRARFNNVATRREPAPARGDLSEGYGPQFTGFPDPVRPRRSSPPGPSRPPRPWRCPAWRASPTSRSGVPAASAPPTAILIPSPPPSTLCARWPAGRCCGARAPTPSSGRSERGMPRRRPCSWRTSTRGPVHWRSQPTAPPRCRCRCRHVPGAASRPPPAERAGASRSTTG